MSELIDLSYYKILPQQFGAQPKILINEITNDIEYYCCTSPAQAVIEYAFSKICEICDIYHEKVSWGCDLKFVENRHVTVTPFNLNKEWIYCNDKDKFNSLDNKEQIEFVLLLTSMFGGSLWNDDVIGYNENNTFKKAFHYNSMFEIELAMFNSKGPGLELLFGNNLTNLLNEYSSDELQIMKKYIDNFNRIKKHEWLDIFDFPESAKFDKSKFWLLKKIGNIQKEFIYYFDK